MVTERPNIMSRNIDRYRALTNQFCYVYDRITNRKGIYRQQLVDGIEQQWISKFTLYSLDDTSTHYYTTFEMCFDWELFRNNLAENYRVPTVTKSNVEIDEALKLLLN